MDGLRRYPCIVLGDYCLIEEEVWGGVGDGGRVELWYGLGGEVRHSSGLYALRTRNGLKLELAKKKNNNNIHREFLFRNNF